MSERRKRQRKDFSFYMRLIDNDTQELIGYLVDISPGGFKIDSETRISANTDFRFRMELSSEVANKPFITFIARSIWCELDPLDPFNYHIGFELIHIIPGDYDIFTRTINKYGSKPRNKPTDKRRSNLW